MAELTGDSAEMPANAPVSGDAGEVQENPAGAAVGKLEMVGFH
jgi:hypothetical protein